MNATVPVLLLTVVLGVSVLDMAGTECGASPSTSSCASANASAPHGTAIGASSPGARTMRDLVVTSHDQMRGATVLLPDGARALVQELVFGVTGDLHFFPAYIAFVSPENGQVVELDARDEAAFLFDDMRSLGGFFMDFGSGDLRHTIWVDELTIGMNEDGALVRLGLSGLAADGTPIHQGLSLDDPPMTMCACQWQIGCSAVSGCNACKPPTQGCKCDNPSGGPRCTQYTTCVCPVDGACAAGTSCQSSGPGACGCLP